MKKTSLLALILLASIFAACGGPAKPDVTPADDAEQVLEIKRFWQLQDTGDGVDATKALHCKYSHLQTTDAGVKVADAESNTSGSCKWSDLEASAGAATREVPPLNVKALTTIIAGIEFPAGDNSKSWDCATLEVTTNKRTFVAKDCALRDREQTATQKDWTRALDDRGSKNADEAAYRLNGAF